MGAESKRKLESARAQGPFLSIRDVLVRTRLPANALASLAQAGAFDSLLGELGGRERRREALWTVLREGRVPIEGLASHAGDEGRLLEFEPLDRSQRIVQDYVFTGLSTEGHPMEILRPALAERGVLSAAQLRLVDDGVWVRTAGLVIVRQRPGTAKGFVFISLEDETGMTNVIVTPQLFERYHRAIMAGAFLEIHGVAQIEGQSVQVRGRRFFSLHHHGTPSVSRDFH
jgi:error-prone DNA polymerase